MPGVLTVKEASVTGVLGSGGAASQSQDHHYLQHHNSGVGDNASLATTATRTFSVADFGALGSCTSAGTLAPLTTLRVLSGGVGAASGGARSFARGYHENSSFAQQPGRAATTASPVDPTTTIAPGPRPTARQRRRRATDLARPAPRSIRERRRPPISALRTARGSETAAAQRRRPALKLAWRRRRGPRTARGRR
jgi:hypothetical protein